MNVGIVKIFMNECLTKNDLLFNIFINFIIVVLVMDFNTFCKKLGLRDEFKDRLLSSGVNTLDMLSGCTKEDLMGIGIPKLLAQSLIIKAKEFLNPAPASTGTVNGIVMHGGKVEGNAAVQGVNYGNVYNGKVEERRVPVQLSVQRALTVEKNEEKNKSVLQQEEMNSLAANLDKIVREQERVNITVEDFLKQKSNRYRNALIAKMNEKRSWHTYLERKGWLQGNMSKWVLDNMARFENDSDANPAEEVLMAMLDIDRRTNKSKLCESNVEVLKDELKDLKVDKALAEIISFYGGKKDKMKTENKQIYDTDTELRKWVNGLHAATKKFANTEETIQKLKDLGVVGIDDLDCLTPKQLETKFTAVQASKLYNHINQ